MPITRSATSTAGPAPVTTRGVPAAAIRNGSKVYGGGPAAVAALHDVSVDFERGRFTAIMGPSGSGKSTLLHALAGLDRLDSGTITIGGKDLGSLSDRNLTRLRREQVGFVFQSFNLIPTLTARDNITLPLDIAGHAVDEDWFDTVVATVGLGDRLDHRPSQLSGGQQQRLAAARAMVSRPKIIFADEPSGNLDSVGGADLLGFLRRAVREFDQTIVMVTHDPVAACYAERVVFLADGRLAGELAEPTVDSILDRMKTLGA